MIDSTMSSSKWAGSSECLRIEGSINIRLIKEEGFFSTVATKLGKGPSLNTGSCINGLLVVCDFCFGPIGQPGQYRKKASGPIVSNF